MINVLNTNKIIARIFLIIYQAKFLIYEENNIVKKNDF